MKTSYIGSIVIIISFLSSCDSDNIIDTSHPSSPKKVCANHFVDNTIHAFEHTPMFPIFRIYDIEQEKLLEKKLQDSLQLDKAHIMLYIIEDNIYAFNILMSNRNNQYVAGFYIHDKIYYKALDNTLCNIFSYYNNDKEHCAIYGEFVCSNYTSTFYEMSFDYDKESMSITAADPILFPLDPNNVKALKP